ncbi:hypothetical protein GCM10029964_023200 [Kibdelosporangium lantanae]
MARTLLLTNDYPPRPGGIQLYLQALATHLPPDELVVYAPSGPARPSSTPSSRSRWSGTPLR